MMRYFNNFRSPLQVESQQETIQKYATQEVKTQVKL